MSTLSKTKVEPLRTSPVVLFYIQSLNMYRVRTKSLLEKSQVKTGK